MYATMKPRIGTISPTATTAAVTRRAIFHLLDLVFFGPLGG